MILAEDLRLSILQAAIEGKLTRQSFKDTPVEITLAELKDIKNSLVKNKKIKNIIPKTDDSVPFSIPDSWTWVKLCDVGELSRGKSKHRPRNDESLFIDGTVPMIQTGDVAAANKYITKFNTCYNEKGLAQSRLWKQGTLCITIAANIGDVAILTFDACFPDSVLGFLPFSEQISTEYLYYMLLAYKHRMNSKASKVAQSNLSLDKINSMLFPFPPIEEQQRIAERLNGLLFKVDEYERIEQQLTILKNKFPSDMRNAILQAAMQGKLTQQLETDTSVTSAYTEIIMERQNLINNKIIKNERISAVDEPPFDIPNSWQFIRMGETIKLLSGQDFASDKYSDIEITNAIPYLTGASNIENGTIIINRWTNQAKAIAHKNDLLITCKGTVGAMAFLPIQEAHIARQIMAINTLGTTNIFYIKYCIENFILSIKAKSKSEIPGIDRSVLLNLVIPLPPIEEQQRIVKRLDILLPLCDSLNHG
jgi:type I restriction enzyme S subunit